jgi:RNA polymerase sigma-70 factor (ECF subfamily)
MSSEAKSSYTSMTAVIEDDFTRLAERHRRELHVHCYRMLGSFEEAEDHVQETFLRAWRGRETFQGGSLFRAWLYKIATNVCLDTLKRGSRRLTKVDSFAEVPWLQPYPDRLLDEIAPTEEQPDAVVVARETIELTYIALIQLLPPRQRAALILRDVLGWSAAETAKVLDTSVAAANSALQRARATVGERLPEPRPEELTDDERRLLQGFIETHELQDSERAVALMREDIRITMPPQPMVFQGRDSIAPLLATAFGDSMGEWRLVPTRANRMPTAASYLRRPGDTEFRAFKFDVLRVEDGRIAEVTTFGDSLFAEFGLAPTL